MYAKKVKRKCSVRGCKETDCYAISRSREMGNSVIICKSCLEEALIALPNAKEKPKRADRGAPVLFFPEALKQAEEKESELACPVCGKVCKSELGLKSHAKTHEAV